MRVFSDSALGQYILACLAAAMDKPAPNERQKPAAHARIRYRAYVRSRSSDRKLLMALVCSSERCDVKFLGVRPSGEAACGTAWRENGSSFVAIGRD